MIERLPPGKYPDGSLFRAGPGLRHDFGCSLLARAVAVFLLLLGGPALAAKLQLVATWESGDSRGTEIVSYQAGTTRLAVSNSRKGWVKILSLRDPRQPKLLQTFSGFSGEWELNSVAFHPDRDVIAVALAHTDGAAGEVRILSASRGKELARYEAGYGPDDVRFSPDGKFLAIPNEAERYRKEEGQYVSHPGSVTLVDLAGGFTRGVVHQVPFAPLQEGHGLTVRADAREMGREVDGREVSIPFDSGDPAHIEPEYVAFSPDSSILYVSLQENNGVAVIDVSKAQIRTIYPLGTTEHAADIEDDDRVDFSDTLIAFREPDQLAVTPDGRFLVTADEGDSDPKASKTYFGPTGGGRTVSVLDAHTGEILGDTGNQIDVAAHRVGLYPDRRSDNKGSEPEGVTVFAHKKNVWAVAGLKRADALALIRITNPKWPSVVEVRSLHRLPGKKKLAPEGLAHFVQHGLHYIAVANEKNGTVSIVRVNLDE